ncbi:10137_t:CDS:2 [Racocetra fulgida]|uniref:10137_t:CDS:1 n=1 Tax=Racocetra fulgida TaxID=60492 RepID=A0A9N9H664_9GLOM|nr:10137_t:CDS:2 [Racocetra fulgida]
MSEQSSQGGNLEDTSKLPQSTPSLVGKLLIERLDSSSISSNSTVFLSHCEDIEYIVDSTCTKIMIGKYDLNSYNYIAYTKPTQLNKYILKKKLNTQVQTIQVDQCQNVNLQYENLSNFHSVVWTDSDQICLKVFEGGEEESVAQDAPSDKESIKLNPYQYIVRLIDDKLVTEKLIRAEKGFPITQRELDEWKVKNNITS